MKTYFKLLTKVLGVLFVSFCLFSCESGEFDTVGSEALDDNFIAEEAYPETSGKQTTISWYGEELQVIEFTDENGDTVYKNGDILYSLADVKASNEDYKLTGRRDRRWPNNTVFYRIDPNLTNTRRVTDAIAHWERFTNLRFVVRTNQPNFINFQTGGGCSSSVGMTGRQQAINLAPGCSTGNTIHEIGHAVGVYHEQSDPNRDNFVRINFENIQAGRENNFRSVSSAVNFGGTFDFGSIMMYGSTFFSSNGQQTITRIDGNGPNYSIQRRALSDLDIRGLEIMYPPISGPDPDPDPDPDPNPDGRTVSFKGNNGLFVSSEDGRQAMNCNRTARNRWERFTIIDEGNGLVSLMGSNGRYVSAENGVRPMTCTKTSSGPSEKFILVNQSGNNVGIRANINGRYVSSENGTKPMIANRASLRAWEVFEMTDF